MKITDLSTPVFGGGKSGGGASKQITLLSITTAPTGTFEKGSQYYNSSTKKIYIAVEDNSWENAKVENPQFGVIYIFDNQGTIEYYQWDGDNLVETDLEKYQLVSNISQDFEEDSENKYPSSKALKEGLDSLKTLPTIVTDSGSSLPVDLTGYQEGDTFFNTSDKKIYKALADSYELNTNTNLYGKIYGTSGSTSAPTVDYITGIMTGADLYQHQYAVNTYYAKYIQRYVSQNFRWKGNKEYKLHFKLNSAPNDDKKHNIMYIKNVTGYNGYNVYTVIHICIKNKNLYIGSYSLGYYGTTELVSPVLLNDFNLDVATEYYVTISKQDNKIVTIVSSNSYDGQVLKSQTIDSPISDVSDYSSNETYISYGGDELSNNNASSSFSIASEGFSIGQIYLLDSSGEFLKASSVLSWDSGVAIEDKNEYADKTNGILYLYSDDELVAIGGTSV